MSMIDVKKLTKDYGHGRGIFDVSLDVHKGETLGFLGPNGAGKSTTMRHLMGFSKPQSGQAFINGLDCSKKHHKILESVGYLPGEVALPDGLNGWGFIKMMGKMRSNTQKDRTAELLERFRLDPSGSVRKMSIGEKRKLAVVAAFMSDPDILLLDEPTSGLDPMMQEVFIDFIREEKKKGKTILLSSHIFSEVEALCDRITIIKDGKIISTVDAAEIKHGLHNIMTVEFDSEAELDKFVQSGIKPEIADRSTRRCRVIVDDNRINGFIKAIKNCRIKHFEEHCVSLEEYFMHFYKNNKTFGGVGNA